MSNTNGTIARSELRVVDMPKQYMAIDQYGETYHSLGAFPRKALCERLNCKHVSKMFVDSKDGKQTFFVGYVIGKQWLNLYEVTPVRTPRPSPYHVK